MDCTYVEHFRRFGYAVIRGVFNRREVSELSDAFDHIYAEGLRHRASFRDRNVFFQLAEDPLLGRIVRMVQWPSYFDAVMARYRVDLRMLRILKPLLGDNLKQIINQMHWKPAGASRVEFGYHQDIRSRRPRSAYRMPDRSYIQTGIAVDPHHCGNGAMTVIPGSHRLGELAFDTGTRVMDRPLRDDDLRALGLRPADAVHLTLQPGDVALWHLYLVHGSGANATTGDRRFLINGYVTADNCSRGEWAFREGRPCALGEPVLVHYDDLHTRPGPFYLD